MVTFNAQAGDTRYVVATFTDAVTGALVDPTIVRGHIKSPSGAVNTYVYNTNAELTKVSTGVYKLKVSIPYLKSSTGLWTADMQGMNSLSDSVEVASLQIKVEPGVP